MKRHSSILDRHVGRSRCASSWHAMSHADQGMRVTTPCHSEIKVRITDNDVRQMVRVREAQRGVRS